MSKRQGSGYSTSDMSGEVGYFLSSMVSIHDEINALFSWNPPRLKPITLIGKRPSRSSRPPAFYVKHFSDLLVLKRVKRLPTLVQDLAANVDRALFAASKALPPVDGFFTAKGA